MNGSHLVRLNIAPARAPMDDPIMAHFVAQLVAINPLAAAAPGFAWRLQDDSGNATAIQAFADPHLLINMSVWDSAEALFAYVYKTGHAKVLARRSDWFERGEEAGMVLWWVPAGHRPSLDEATARLEALRQNGPSSSAFTFKDRFPAPARAA